MESLGKTETICYVGRNYEGELKYGDIVTITFWFYAGANFNVTGYFWATRDGELPTTTGDTLPLGTEALLEISEFAVRRVPIDKSSHSSGYISPVFTYKIIANETCKLYTWVNLFQFQQTPQQSFESIFGQPLFWSLSISSLKLILVHLDPLYSLWKNDILNCCHDMVQICYFSSCFLQQP